MNLSNNNRNIADIAAYLSRKHRGCGNFPYQETIRHTSAKLPLPRVLLRETSGSVLVIEVLKRISKICNVVIPLRLLLG